jgi:endonuclease YncB( thermonuclease family)
MLLPVVAAAAALSVGAVPARVLRVIDGDTIVAAALAQSPTTIRLLGIDCPETHANEKCLCEEREGRGLCREQLPDGARAKVRAEQLLEDPLISLEPKYAGARFALNPYGRTL